MKLVGFQIADCRLQIYAPGRRSVGENLQSAIRNLKFFLPLLVDGWLCASACASPPQQPRQVQKKDAASAWFAPRADRLTLRLADEATVTLRVEAPAPLEVEVLEKPKATPQWSLKAEGPPVLHEAKGKGEAVWEQKYQLEPHKEGEHLVELPPLRYRTGAGEWHKV